MVSSPDSERMVGRGILMRLDLHSSGSRRLERALLFALAPFAVITLVGLVVLWPEHAHPLSAAGAAGAELDDAHVVRVDVAPCRATGVPTCYRATIKLTSGTDSGTTATLDDLTFGPGTPVLHRGDDIVVTRSAEPDGQTIFSFADFQRGAPLGLLAAVFAVVVVGVARWRGLGAIVGLVITWLVLVRFVIPAILDGRSPVAVALIGGALILFVVVYVAHGYSARTTTALLGTLISLGLTALLAAAFVAATHLTGASSDEAFYVQAVTGGQISLSGLLLAGIVIGSLGVLNDVTVTQASAVWEIHSANPERGRRELYSAGMRVGRDHIASVVYTLVLAYAGASLPLLIIFTVSGEPLTRVIGSSLVAEELVRALVGSIGLVASVPVTTALAAAVVKVASAPVTPDEPGLEYFDPSPKAATAEAPPDEVTPEEALELPELPAWRRPRGERELWGEE